jgi:hypothetical protein
MIWVRSHGERQGGQWDVTGGSGDDACLLQAPRAIVRVRDVRAMILGPPRDRTSDRHLDWPWILARHRMGERQVAQPEARLHQAVEAQCGTEAVVVIGRAQEQVVHLVVATGNAPVLILLRATDGQVIDEPLRHKDAVPPGGLDLTGLGAVRPSTERHMATMVSMLGMLPRPVDNGGNWALSGKKGTTTQGGQC